MKRLLIFFVCSLTLAACSSSAEESAKTPISKEEEAVLPGKLIFTQNCKLCHGSDGTLGLSGAANLKMSALTIDEKIQVITNGRRGMASWKSQLSPEEIVQVAQYVETLKK